jgi:hypothetical protein
MIADEESICRKVPKCKFLSRKGHCKLTTNIEQDLIQIVDCRYKIPILKL